MSDENRNSGELPPLDPQQRRNIQADILGRLGNQQKNTGPTSDPVDRLLEDILSDTLHPDQKDN